jgi:hypothetical protein
VITSATWQSSGPCPESVGSTSPHCSPKLPGPSADLELWTMTPTPAKARHLRKSTIERLLKQSRPSRPDGSMGRQDLGWVTMSERDVQRIGVLSEVIADRRTIASSAAAEARGRRRCGTDPQGPRTTVQQPDPRRGAAGLTSKLGKASLMLTMSARRIETNRADMVQAFDQPEHRDRLRRFRHLAQPGQPALAGFGPALRQRIKPPPLVGRQPIGQPALDLPSRLIAEFDAEPFKRSGLRADDPALPAFLHHQLGQMGKSIILNRVRQQPGGQLSGRARAKGTEPKSVLQFRRMTPAVLLRGEIVINGFRRTSVCSATNETRAAGGRCAQGTTGVTQVAKHKRVAEAVMIATAASDHRDIRIGKRVVAHQFTLIGERIEQRGELGFGQLLPSCHSHLPGP